MSGTAKQNISLQLESDHAHYPFGTNWIMGMVGLVPMHLVPMHAADSLRWDAE